MGDVPSATAILDRFLHHAEVIQITGKSYRLRRRAGAGSEAHAENEAASSKKKPTKTAAPTTAPS